MRFMRTSERGAGPLGDLVGRQEPRRLQHPALAMHPLGLDRIQPRTLARQQAAEDAQALPAALDPLIVRR